MKVIIICLFLLKVVLGNEFRIRNNCHFTVWPGLSGNPGFPHPEGGGFELKSGGTHTFQVQHDWAGRIWGRTNCGANGHCETGDCGSKIKCQGWGQPPTTLAEFKLNGWGNQDFYDISQVDGFNLPLRINPIPGTFKKALNGHYDCNAINCGADVNAKCPTELSIKSGGHTIACESACTKFRTDVYCCSGALNDRNKCTANKFPHNYPAYFKGMCPDAYSWAFDDATSTFTCHGNPQTAYEVVFCP